MNAPVILLSQRVAVDPAHGERRDALDQRWAGLLAELGFIMVPVPNLPDGVETLAERVGASGVLLTGGNDLVSLGGDVPERDAAEARLLAWGRRQKVPVLGVCRGMQFLLAAFGARLEPVPGHVAIRHAIIPAGLRESVEVNSYHGFAARALPPGLVAAATAEDGVIEAFHHAGEAIAGLMWHPEREAPWRRSDLDLLRRFFRDGLLRIEP